MVRVDEDTGLGVALATDCNGRFAYLDPYAGRAARSGRGVPQRGGHRRAAARDHRLPELRLPEDPAVMWQFAEAVAGLADGCRELGTPVTGRQRELLQPDRGHRHPADPGGRGCSG